MRKADTGGERGKRLPEVETAVWLLGHVADLPEQEQRGAAAEMLMMMGFEKTPEVEARKRVPAPQVVPGKRTATRQGARDQVSDCCEAELETAGSVTRYYVCTKCDMPCDSKAS